MSNFIWTVIFSSICMYFNIYLKWYTLTSWKLSAGFNSVWHRLCYRKRICTLYLSTTNVQFGPLICMQQECNTTTQHGTLKKKKILIEYIFYNLIIYIHVFTIQIPHLRPKKKIVMLPSPDQNLKIGSVGRDFFFFFYVPWESWVF